MQTIYLDIMVEGRFYKQLTYNYPPLFRIEWEDVQKFILNSLPSLRGKKWEVGFSKQRV